MNLTAKLRGSKDAVLDRVMSLMAPAVVRAEVLDGGEILADEMRRRVPRETGELEGEIVAHPLRAPPGQFFVNVGVPESSPAIEKARATEFGTWNYGVGTPQNPKTRWAAKSKPGAVMPWARTSVLARKTDIIRRWRNGLAARARKK